MLQSLKPLCLIHFGWIPFSQFLHSFFWGNKNWHIGLIMGGWVKRWKNLGTKSVSQAENGPVRMLQALKPLCLIHFGWITFSQFLHSSFWGNKNWPFGFIMGGWVKRWKHLGTKSVSQAANGPVRILQALKPLCLIHFGWIPFSQFLHPSFWGNKNWQIEFIMGGWVKRWKNLGTKSV